MFFAHQFEEATVMVIGLGLAMPAVHHEPVQIGDGQNIDHRV
jgi:hypothetical protein